MDPSKPIMEDSTTTPGFLSGYWLIGTILAPFTLPWVLYKALGRLFYKYQRSSLDGKVVLITGATSGLGEALAHSFYKSGCRVILAARRKTELERVKNDLLASYPCKSTCNVPIIIELDLSDLQSIQPKVKSILSIANHIDILVNNAGISCRGNVLTTDLEVYQQLMLTNFFGQVALTKAILPSMVDKRSGHIVVVSSVQGVMAIPSRSAYAASKHATQAFFDSLRAEVADYNVNVTVVSPGYIKTELSLNALTGSGGKYGQMDDSTAKGYSTEYVAEEIIAAVLERKKELIIAQLTARIAIILRKFIPSLYFYLMAKRAQKSN